MAATAGFQPALLAAGVDPRVHWGAMHHHWCVAMWSFNMAQLHLQKIHLWQQLQHQNAIILYHRANRLLARGRPSAKCTDSVADVSSDAEEECKHSTNSPQQQQPNWDGHHDLDPPLTHRTDTDSTDSSSLEENADEGSEKETPSESAASSTEEEEDIPNPNLLSPPPPEPTSTPTRPNESPDPPDSCLAPFDYKKSLLDIKAAMQEAALEQALERGKINKRDRYEEDVDEEDLSDGSDSDWDDDSLISRIPMGCFTFKDLDDKRRAKRQADEEEKHRNHLIGLHVKARPELLEDFPQWTKMEKLQLYKYDPEDMYPDDIPYDRRYDTKDPLFDLDLWSAWKESLQPTIHYNKPTTPPPPDEHKEFAREEASKPGRIDTSGYSLMDRGLIGRFDPEFIESRPQFLEFQLFRYPPEDMFPEDKHYDQRYDTDSPNFDCDLYWDWRESLPEDY